MKAVGGRLVCAGLGREWGGQNPGVRGETWGTRQSHWEAPCEFKCVLDYGFEV
jgi:hypothetical protein